MNILFMGTSDFGGVSSYVSTIIKYSKGFKFFLFKDKSMDEHNLEKLYQKSTIISFDQKYLVFSLRKLFKLRKHILKHDLINYFDTTSMEMHCRRPLFLSF